MEVQISDRIQTMDELEQRLFSGPIPQAAPIQEKPPEVAAMRKTYAPFHIAAMVLTGIFLVAALLVESAVPANIRGSSSGYHYSNSYWGIQCTLGSDWDLLSDAKILKINGLNANASVAEYEKAMNSASEGMIDMLATDDTGSLLQVHLGRITLQESFFSETVLLNEGKDSLLKSLTDSRKVTIQTSDISEISLAGKTHPCVHVVGRYENTPLYLTVVLLKRETNVAFVAAWSFTMDNTTQLLSCFQPL